MDEGWWNLNCTSKTFLLKKMKIIQNTWYKSSCKAPYQTVYDIMISELVMT